MTATIKALSLEEAVHICKYVAPVGDTIFDCSDALSDSGFSAFRPFQEFYRSFCVSDDECAQNQRYWKEKAKVLLGRPAHMKWEPAQLALIYKSPYLEDLHAKNDAENGVPYRDVHNRYPGEIWRSEVDACERRRVFDKIKNRAAYEERNVNTRDQAWHVFETESLRHATKLGESHSFDGLGFYAFFVAAMTRYCEPLGFALDAKKSTKLCPVFSKQIADTWDLCFAIEDSQSFAGIGEFAPVDGRFELCLELRHRQRIGPAGRAKRGELLHLQYLGTVWWFKTAYWKFSNLDQLETIIKAHLGLYALMGPAIEAGVREGFRTLEMAGS